jgi:hypothetical protein
MYPSFVLREAPRAGGKEQRSHQGDALASVGARAAQYAIEHGYLRMDEVPAVVGSLNESAWDGALLLAMLRRAGEREGAAPPARLDVRDSYAGWGGRLQAFAETDGPTLARLREWGRRASGEEAAESSAQDLLAAAVEAAIDVPFLESSDQVDLSLSLPGAPLATNGSWDDSTQRVVWSTSVATRTATRPGVPFVAFAAWAESDGETQTRLLGRRILEGEPLARYALWHAGLAPDDRRVWDAFLEQASPSPDLATRLRAFRPPGREHDEMPPPGAALIADALESPKEGEGGEQ